MAGINLIFLIALPLAFGLCSIFFSNHLRQQLVQISAQTTTILAVIVSLFAIFTAPAQAPICITWQPSVGQMCLAFEPSSMLLVMLSAIALSFLLLCSSFYKIKLSAVQMGLMSISFSTANIVLLTTNFLMRYAALEITALCLMGSIFIVSLAEHIKRRHLVIVFLNMRLGDIALLIAIFTMYAFSRTFLIDQNFSIAASLLTSVLMVIVSCLLVTVIIKMGVWPLNWWVRSSSTLHSIVYAWFVGLLLPLLGAYLLYRTTPLLSVSETIFRYLVLSIITMAALAFAYSSIQAKQTIALNEVQLTFSSLAIFFVALSGVQDVVYGFILFWLVARLAMLLTSLWFHAQPKSPPIYKRIVFLATHISLFAISWLALGRFIVAYDIPTIFTLIFLPVMWIIFVRTIAIFMSGITEKRMQSKQKQIMQNFSMIFLALCLAFAWVLLSNIVSAPLMFALKGKSTFLISDAVRKISLSSFFNNVWLSALLAAILYFIIWEVQDLRKKWQYPSAAERILLQDTSTKRPNDGTKDPLDLTKPIVAIFGSAATFLYNNVENVAFDKLVHGIQRVFEFLFSKVEQFTSGDIWLKALEILMNSSRKMQNAHTGFLRWNLMWLLLFLIVMVIIVFGVQNSWTWI